MVQRFTITVFSLLLFFNFSYSQEVQRANIKYTPSDNGYELNIPFAWKFINCYGEVHVTITKNTKDITSNAYIYNGVRYTSTELGNDAFAKPECGLTDISADVYHNAYKLGNVKMGNVIDWLGGCFGQTYHITKLLGINDADYKDKVSELSLSNLKIDNLSSRDYSVESKIKEIEKQKSLNEKITQADNAYARGNLDEAKKLYDEVLKIEYSNEHAKGRIAEIKAKKISEKKEEEFKSHLENGEKLEEEGDYEGAKSTYQKALEIKPENETVQNKLKELEEKLNEEKDAQRNKSEAVSAAANRSHSGSIWGKNHGSDSYGTATQAANLIGYFRLDYNIWTLAGEPAHKFKFYWEWDNALNSGYPQWVSVLLDEVVMIKELEKYPDLFNRWNNIKPEYIEVECEILYYKNGDEFVADVGKIRVVPEVIGYSGQEVDWSLPSSSNWDELFPYCNGMEWGYFRKLGLYEEINEYEDKFETDIAWPKYAFEYSDNINFFQSHSYFHSEILQKWIDTDNYSSSADIIKVVWPVEEIQSVIKEFEEREKQKKEEKMSADDFWHTPESEKKNKNNDFWDSPENDMTQTDLKQAKLNRENRQIISEWSKIISRQREKYRALQNPFTITTPLDNSVHKKNVIKVEGSINKYFQKYSNEVFLNLNGVRQQVDVNGSGNFSNAMVLSNGLNEIKLELKGNGFTIEKPLKIKYEGVETDIRVTLTWNTSGSDLDLYVEDPNSSTCSYNNKNVGKMSLDVDDTDGYGAPTPYY